jgi:pyridoxamine 5'-phosphate oxidase
MKAKSRKLDTLDGVLNDVWKMLNRGVKRFDDPFHRPVLGTSGQDGCNMRTVILRHFILFERILVCHTDARAPKVKEIETSNRVAWLFYHPRKKVQLRICGRATLHVDDPLAHTQWAAVGVASRLNYAATEPPGTPVDKPISGLPDLLRNKLPTLLESGKLRENFMSISCKIESLDWLKLRLTGNRRARFVWDENEVSSTWLIP